MATEELEFEVPVDASLKCTEFKPFILVGGFFPVPHCGRRRKTNPFMRAFWAATLSFMFAFIGAFAFAPLMVVVRRDIGICDNDAEVQMDLENIDGVKCVCKLGCKKIISGANIASVSFDIFMRFASGRIIEQFGPRIATCGFLSWGIIWVSGMAFVNGGTALIITRLFASCLLSTFVINQFWNSFLFNRAVVGTANATGGGWGNLGGGLTQVLMPAAYRFWHDGVGLSLRYAWRASMALPVALYLCLVPWIWCCTQDTPTCQKLKIEQLGKTKKAGFKTYIEVLSDYRVVLMIFQYSACFGCELVMTNKLASHFHDYFGVDLFAAGLMAMTFGGMNLFARSFGGILSDRWEKRWGMTGRLWAHFLSLLGQAVFLFGFGSVTEDMGPAVAVVVLALFAIFVNMAEGTTYGITPYTLPKHMAVVSGVVGAGGTAGAVIATWCFYMFVEDPLLPFRLHAGYVLVFALTVPLMRFEELGSMFSRPNKGNQGVEPQSGMPVEKTSEPSAPTLDAIPQVLGELKECQGVEPKSLGPVDETAEEKVDRA